MVIVIVMAVVPISCWLYVINIIVVIVIIIIIVVIILYEISSQLDTGDRNLAFFLAFILYTFG